MDLSRSRCRLVYLGVAVPVCLLLLGHTDLIGMEPIIVLGGRHMIGTGEWLVPKLYGELYAFKPALAYWLTAASESLLGRSEFAARLPTAACGILLGLAIYETLATVVSPRCGLYGALLATTSALFIQQTRMVGFDMPLALGTGLALLAAARNLATKQSSGVYWILGYLGLLFGFLAKGLPALLVYAPLLVVAATVLKQWRILLGRRHLVGGMVFLVGASAYLYLAYGSEGESAFAQQIGEIRYRATRWTLLEVFRTLLKPLAVLIAFLPGSLFVLVAAIRRRRLGLPEAASRLATVSWVFLLAGMFVFMASPTHSTRYYLPLVAPISVLGAIAAESIASDRHKDHRERGRTGNRMSSAHPIVWVVVAGLCHWCVHMGVVEPARAAKKSLRNVAAAFAPLVPPEETIYVDAGDSHSSLFCYLDRRVQTWRLSEPAMPTPVLVLIVDEQRGVLEARTDLHFTILAQRRGPRDREYTLGIVKPI